MIKRILWVAFLILLGWAIGHVATAQAQPPHEVLLRWEIPRYPSVPGDVACTPDSTAVPYAPGSVLVCELQIKYPGAGTFVSLGTVATDTLGPGDVATFLFTASQTGTHQFQVRARTAGGAGCWSTVLTQSLAPWSDKPSAPVWRMGP